MRYRGTAILGDQRPAHTGIQPIAFGCHAQVDVIASLNRPIQCLADQCAVGLTGGNHNIPAIFFRSQLLGRPVGPACHLRLEQARVENSQHAPDHGISNYSCVPD